MRSVLFSHFLSLMTVAFAGTRGRIQTLKLRLVSQVFYHCTTATAQYFVIAENETIWDWPQGPLFYGRNLIMFVVSFSACPWQAILAQSKVCG